MKIQISQSALMFYGILMMGMMGFCGYLFGKVGNLEKAANTPTTQAAAQQQPQQPAKPTISQDQIKGLFDGKRISFGDKNNKLVFVEFSDPSCPFCHVAAGKNPTLNTQMGSQFAMKAEGGSYVPPVPEMKKLVDSGKASMVWIYANGHGNGETATKALYCAHEKGKFWEVHDKLMSADGYALMNTKMEKGGPDPSHPVALDNQANQSLIADYLASQIDKNFMLDCLKSKYNDRLSADMSTALQFGFNGTPSFFVNTQNFAGAYSYTEMQTLVDGILK
jgi:protein-disulfide isomerase